MEKIMVMVNGLPGKMAGIIARGILKSDKYDLLDNSLTGPGQPENELVTNSRIIGLYHPDDHDEALARIKSVTPNMYAIDACKGAGVANQNAALYCKYKIPFVILSTGADYKLIEKLAEETQTPCVAYPNMDVRIVTWMAGIKYMAENYSGSFEDSKISLAETHQADKVNADGKPETSGTMKNMLKHLGDLVGDELLPEKILSVRDPNVQAKILAVPDNWIGWHAYHFFKISNEHDGVEDYEELTFKRHGGECYRRGAMLALDFLTVGNWGKYFNNMIDVLK